MKKNFIMIIVVLVIAAGAFFGGIKYGQGKAFTPTALAKLNSNQRQEIAQSLRGNMTGQNNRMGNGFRMFGGGQTLGGNAVAGQIIAKDDKSITVKTQDGSSKIVFYSSSTTIGKMTQGSAADLNIGEEIFAGGSTNSDGTVTAQNIQIRPTMPNASSTPGSSR